MRQTRNRAPARPCRTTWIASVVVASLAAPNAAAAQSLFDTAEHAEPQSVADQPAADGSLFAASHVSSPEVARTVATVRALAELRAVLGDTVEVDVWDELDDLATQAQRVGAWLADAEETERSAAAALHRRREALAAARTEARPGETPGGTGGLTEAADAHRTATEHLVAVRAVRDLRDELEGLADRVSQADVLLRSAAEDRAGGSGAPTAAVEEWIDDTELTTEELVERERAIESAVEQVLTAQDAERDRDRRAQEQEIAQLMVSWQMQAPRTMPPSVGGHGWTPTGAASGDWATRIPEHGRVFAAEIERAAERNGIEPELLAALVWAESNFRPEVVSHAGAIGLAQLMPGTARGLGVNPYNPAENLDGGARYLRYQLNTFGSVELALAAYNAGPTRVRQAGGIPNIRETQLYVPKVLGYYQTLRG